MSADEHPARSLGRDNAFRRSYLESLLMQDEPPEAGEGAFTGPWELRPTDGEFALFRSWESAEMGDVPEGIFATREAGLTFLSTAASLEREPLFLLGAERGPAGYPVLRGTAVVGHLRLSYSRWVEAAHYAACVTRSPLALAALIETTGLDIRAGSGQILGRRFFHQAR
jgi:hypothetical protein